MSPEVRLSVIVPVHNAERYIEDAITSILGQTFADFEVIAVDDRSTDGSLGSLRAYARWDRRVRVIALDKQVGVASALNVGIARAAAPLIARMDADDVAHPDRFAVQVAEMDRDQSLGLLGAHIEVIGHDGSPEAMFPWELPTTHDETVWRLLYGSPICHPTAVMRTEVVRRLGGYDPRFVNEDMELWTRMALITGMRNLDAVLLKYRMPAAAHARKLAAWQPHLTRVSQRYLEQIVGVPVAESVVRALRRVGTDGEPGDVLTALSAFGAASLLVHAFDRMGVLGMFRGDGLQRVSELMHADVQELAAGVHLDVAGHR